MKLFPFAISIREKKGVLQRIGLVEKKRQKKDQFSLLELQSERVKDESTDRNTIERKWGQVADFRLV